MFSLVSRKNQDKVKRFMFRFINHRSMAKIKVLEQGRHEERIDVNVGVWVAPMIKGRPEIDLAFRALTKNFNSTGVGLFVDHEIQHPDVLLRLVSDDQTMFLRAEVIDSTPLGAGYYLVGLQVEDLVVPTDFKQLDQLEKLLAESTQP